MITKQANPTIATYASDNEVEIRLTASAKTKAEAEANQLLDGVEAEISARDGEFIYGYGDETLADVVVRKLLSRKITIAAAESLTAGAFQAELGAHSGVSEIF